MSEGAPEAASGLVCSGRSGPRARRGLLGVPSPWPPVGARGLRGQAGGLVLPPENVLCSLGAGAGVSAGGVSLTANGGFPVVGPCRLPRQQLPVTGQVRARAGFSWGLPTCPSNRRSWWPFGVYRFKASHLNVDAFVVWSLLSPDRIEGA